MLMTQGSSFQDVEDTDLRTRLKFFKRKWNDLGMHSNHFYTGRVIFQIEGDQRGRELTQEHLLAYNGLVGWGRNAVLVPTCHMAMSMLEVLTEF